MTATAYIALGSNEGDRRDFLDRALAALRANPGITVSRVSAYHETAPVGGPPGQAPYLNAAAELQTDLEPRALLRLLLEIERTLGRVRHERFGPRTIDLDLLLHSDQVLQADDLMLPHPRMHERAFVLEPLVEIAPDIRHPILHQSVRQLVEALRARAAGQVLKARRALVTGASSGIGRAIARELAAGGADVIIHGRRPEAAQAVADELLATRVRSGFLCADLHDALACDQLVEDAFALWGGLDIWINNAGADTLTGQAGRWPFARKLEELLAIDVVATIHLSRAAGERMKAAGSGVLLTMGWDQAETGMEGDSGQLFAAAKGAVMAFTRSLALSLAPAVRVNCLAPGWIRTAWGEQASTAWQERVRRETPLGRWGTPDDVAAAARWLVSPAAAFLTGQIIRINGGAVRS